MIVFNYPLLHVIPCRQSLRASVCMLHYNNLISSWENIVRAPGATCWTGLDCRIGDLLVTLMCAYVAQLKLEIDISDVDCGSVSIYVIRESGALKTWIMYGLSLKSDI